jgi:VWFA-related protein
MNRPFFAIAPALVLSAVLFAGPQSGAPPKPSPSPAPSPSPEAAATFTAGVELVNVDAVVTDKKGGAVAGLKKEDFTLTEDGQPQTIVSFESIEVPPLAPGTAPPKRPRIATNMVPVSKAGRSFIVLFDDVHLTPSRARLAKTAVAEFLKTGVREGDHVMLVAAGGDAWWSARMEGGRDQLIKLLKRLEGRLIPDMSQDRVTDYEAMRIQGYSDPEVIARVQRRFQTYGVSSQPQSQTNQVGGASNAYRDTDPQVLGKATEVYYQSVSRNRITLDAMERSLNAFAGTKGRKSLILVSEGFIYDPNMEEFKKVLDSSRRSDVAIYYLDTRGLQGMPDAFSAEFGPAIDTQDIGAAFAENWQESEGSQELASDSGGFTINNSNDLVKGIQKIADESKVYYLIGYNPTNTKKDGRFRKIGVKVARKGVDVRARKGYYAPLEGGKAPKPPKPGTADPAIQQAVDSPFDMDGIPLRMTAYAMNEALLGKAHVVVATDVDIRSFGFEEKDGRFLDTLEFLLVVAHRESGEYFRYDQNVDMKLLPETREKIAKTWYTVARDFDLVAGGYQAKIVVRDKKTGKIGTVIHEFEVPDQGSFRVSDPLLSDVVQAPPEGEKGVPRVPLLVRRDFAAGGKIFCQFEVYGAEKDKKSGMPQVSAGYDIKKPDGSVALHVEPTVIRPTSLGRLSRIVGSPLSQPPGDYEFVLNVKDEVSGKTLEVKEPFTVVPGGA